MTFDEKEKLVIQFLQGGYPARQEKEISQQISDDPELQQLVEEHSKMISALASLSDVKMPGDLWRRKLRPAVIQQLSGKESEISIIEKIFSLLTAPKFRPALAGIGFVVIMVMSTVMLQNIFFASEPEPYDVALAKIEELREQYSEQLQVLIAEMEIRKELLLPEVQATYDELIIKIDENIAQAERVYAIYSSDEQAVMMLMNAYDDKTKTIQRFMNMTL
jgi:hypothetical protein